MVCPVLIFLQHARVIMQIWQPENDLEVDDVTFEDDLREKISALADVKR